MYLVYHYIKIATCGCYSDDTAEYGLIFDDMNCGQRVCCRACVYSTAPCLLLCCSPCLCALCIWMCKESCSEPQAPFERQAKAAQVAPVVQPPATQDMAMGEI